MEGEAHAARSEQCLNYVRGARRGLFGNEPVQPWWGLVTDMNEFRLYSGGTAPRPNTSASSSGAKTSCRVATTSSANWTMLASTAIFSPKYSRAICCYRKQDGRSSSVLWSGNGRPGVSSKENSTTATKMCGSASMMCSG